MYIGSPLLEPRTSSGLEMVVWAHGASASATSEANRRMIEVLGSLRPSNLALLDGLDIQLHIIPKDKKLTDLLEFSAKKGLPTGHGGVYDDLRGVGGERSGRSILYAVGEETLASIPGYPSPYGSGYVAAHEAGHVVERYTLTTGQRPPAGGLRQSDARERAVAEPAREVDPSGVFRVVDRGLPWTSADELGE